MMALDATAAAAAASSLAVDRSRTQIAALFRSPPLSATAVATATATTATSLPSGASLHDAADLIQRRRIQPETPARRPLTFGPLTPPEGNNEGRSDVSCLDVIRDSAEDAPLLVALGRDDGRVELRSRLDVVDVDDSKNGDDGTTVLLGAADAGVVVVGSVVAVKFAPGWGHGDRIREKKNGKAKAPADDTWEDLAVVALREDGTLVVLDASAIPSSPGKPTSTSAALGLDDKDGGLGGESSPLLGDTKDSGGGSAKIQPAACAATPLPIISEIALSRHCDDPSERPWGPHSLAFLPPDSCTDYGDASNGYVAVGMDGGSVILLSLVGKGKHAHGEGNQPTLKVVRNTSLPSGATSLSFSLSTTLLRPTAPNRRGDRCSAKRTRPPVVLLAVGQIDGETALLDSTPGRDGSCPSFCPFHFIEASPSTSSASGAKVGPDDALQPPSVSSVDFCRPSQFHATLATSGSSGRGRRDPVPLLAIVAGSTVRVVDGATFEVFYERDLSLAGRGSASGNAVVACDVRFIEGSGGGGVDGRCACPTLAIARSDGVVETLTLRRWNTLLSGSSFSKLHARFHPPRSADVGDGTGDALLHHDRPVESICFGSQATGSAAHMAVASGKQVYVYDASLWQYDSAIDADAALSTSSLASGIAHLEIGEDVERVDYVVYSPDGRFLAVAVRRVSDGRCDVLLYGVKSGSMLRVGLQHTVASALNSLVFSPDSSSVLVCANESCVVLSTDNTLGSKATIHVADTVRRTCAAWSHDGTVIAIGCDDSKVVFYETITFAEVYTLVVAGGAVIALDFHVTSSLVAIGCKERKIFVAERRGPNTWKPQFTIPHKGDVRCVKFSPDAASSFLATLGSDHSCQIYSLRSRTLLQEIKSVSNGAFTCISFDPTGALIAIAGETDTPVGRGGEVMVVLVGELLCLDWYPLLLSDVGAHEISPEKVCDKFSMLSKVERAQLLYHTTEYFEPRDTFSLETMIQLALYKRREIDRRVIRGSMRLNTLPHTEEVTTYLSSIFTLFPKSVFASTTDDGSIFETALRRDDPRLLKLAFSIALVSCRTYPCMMLNDEMRGGTLTRALISACHHHSDVVQNTINNMVLWPSPTISIDTWKVPRGLPIYRAGGSPAVEGVFDEDMKKVKAGALAQPMVLPIPGMSSLSFLSALVSGCEADVFSMDELGIILQDLWENDIIKVLFVVDFCCYVVFFALWSILVTKTNVSSSEESFGGTELDKHTFLLLIFVFVINLLFGYRELRQIISSGDKMTPYALLDNFKERVVTTTQNLHAFPLRTAWDGLSWALSQHFEYWWNTFDILTWCMVNVTLLLLIWRQEWTVECAVVTSFFILLKMLSYLRGFENSCWLLSVLYAQWNASRGFLIVIGTMIVGFSVCFRILLGPFDEDYSTYKDVIYTMFDISIVGDFDRSSFKESQNQFLTMSLFILLILVVFIVALNGYISVLGDAYAGVKKHEHSVKNYQRASLIIDYLKMMGRQQRIDVQARREYFFGLVAVDYEDAVGAVNATRAVISREKKLLIGRETFRRINEVAQKEDDEGTLFDMYATIENLSRRLEAVERKMEQA